MFSENIVLKYKVSKNDFTRKRKQSFQTTILFMLNLQTKSLAIEIENLVSFIKCNIGVKNAEHYTKSAFVQCRRKIKPEVFKDLSDSLVEEFYTDRQQRR
ncbi:hypothetical protein JCM21142_104144 [Saccharicrinis fermentans DSM 9555 = JCM 21142]|uniref:Transposase n=1 Tax=Saccharicrinis fermentans DSM 9555 = JCM 21142 TaxID=869213 RepID=W7Y3G6_9BACT|nr:hypothetical protein JCM21142_104144 [Saccharicrinis fermentans DSM 9555 = JCM 21142]